MRRMHFILLTEGIFCLYTGLLYMLPIHTFPLCCRPCYRTGWTWTHTERFNSSRDNSPALAPHGWRIPAKNDRVNGLNFRWNNCASGNLFFGTVLLWWLEQPKTFSAIWQHLIGCRGANRLDLVYTENTLS